VKLYRRIAQLLQARANCLKSGNSEWYDRHDETARKLVADLMPSGSGWDNGTALDFEKSTSEKLVFYGSFHHMDDGGSYAGWTSHTVVVRPSLTSDFELTISGRNRNEIKDYLADLFYDALSQEIDDGRVFYGTQVTSPTEGRADG
jgi:hypothetical protein